MRWCSEPPLTACKGDPSCVTKPPRPCESGFRPALNTCACFPYRKLEMELRQARDLAMSLAVGECAITRRSVRDPFMLIHKKLFDILRILERRHSLLCPSRVHSYDQREGMVVAS